MEEAPLRDQNQDLKITRSNLQEIVKEGRARWKIENETFNSLKNQGYHFEHNFGYRKKYLSSLSAYLMMLAFFIDQCLPHLKKRFQAAHKKWGAKDFCGRFYGLP
jgi:hypothetical protein